VARLEVLRALGRGRARRGFGPTFAAYDAQDIARALRVKAELFGKVEDDVAGRYELAVPEDRPEVLRRLETLLD
jgi:hypothetical protein